MGKNSHHIVPRSRGGRKTPHNISKVDKKKHSLYHQLFDNKTPVEIVKYLNRYFWNNNYQIKMTGEGECYKSDKHMT